MSSRNRRRIRQPENDRARRLSNRVGLLPSAPEKEAIASEAIKPGMQECRKRIGLEAALWMFFLVSCLPESSLGSSQPGLRVRRANLIQVPTQRASASGHRTGCVLSLALSCLVVNGGGAASPALRVWHLPDNGRRRGEGPVRQSGQIKRKAAPAPARRRRHSGLLRLIALANFAYTVDFFLP